MNKPQHPEIYQGFNQTSNYFEGWYFKHVSHDGKFSLACIPGISLSTKDPHAFIQVFLAKHGKTPTLETHYIRFPKDAFSASRDAFDVWIGSNHFTSTFISLDIHEQGLDLEGHLSYHELTPLNKGFLNPSIMGPFAYAPRMECYHGIVSLDHTIKGRVTYQQQTFIFDQGKGYIEKDWGQSFPEHYVWVHANHFPDDKVSFFFSYAKIPYMGLKFLGLITHIYIQGKHYRFATYNGGRVAKEVVAPRRVEYTLKRGSLRLDFHATIDEVADLPSPKHGTMDHVIKEGLSGTVTIKLSRRGRVLYEATSERAGIEIMK